MSRYANRKHYYLSLERRFKQVTDCVARLGSCTSREVALALDVCEDYAQELLHILCERDRLLKREKVRYAYVYRLPDGGRQS